MDFQRFYMGDVYDAYKYLGAHVDQSGVVFRTFAPQAERVTIIGEFNGWQEEEMTQAERAQFYEIRVEGAKTGQMYKYVIYLWQKRPCGALRSLRVRHGTAPEFCFHSQRYR